jgi:hypothetical protein
MKYRVAAREREMEKRSEETGDNSDSRWILGALPRSHRLLPAPRGEGAGAGERPSFTAHISPLEVHPQTFPWGASSQTFRQSVHRPRAISKRVEGARERVACFQSAEHCRLPALCGRYMFQLPKNEKKTGDGVDLLHCLQP